MDKDNGLSIDDNELRSIIGKMYEDYIDIVNLEVPYIVSAKEIGDIAEISKEFEYEVVDVEYKENSTDIQLETTGNSFDEQYQDSQLVEFVNEDIEMTYKGITEFIIGAYESEVYKIELEVPYVLTVSEAGMFRVILNEYCYDISEIWVEDEITYIDVEFTEEYFDKDLSIESVLGR